MEIERRFAMPNRQTFSIPPIRDLVFSLLEMEPRLPRVIDPFCGDITDSLMEWVHESRLYANDLNPELNPNLHGYPPMDAEEYLDMMGDEQFDVAFFDPPYSLRQLKECYDGVGHALTQDDTKYFFSNVKDQIARVVKVGGYVLTCGWSSNGMGKSRGFAIEEILIVNHGGNHHDTICVLEVKKYESS